MMDGIMPELDLTAPAVPDSGVQFMPSAEDSLGLGLLKILQQALSSLSPELKSAMEVCLSILAAVILISVVSKCTSSAGKPAVLVGIAVVSAILLRASDSMIALAARTVEEISEYGKLLIPVMTTALAAQGGANTSSALCAAAVMCNTLLGNLISKILIPMVYSFLALTVAAGAIGAEVLTKLQELFIWLISWSLKVIIYGFTGFLSLSGVISGSTDAAALKVAKMTISGAVPVVGGILSDASEAVLVGASAVKNAVGIYGLFALVAIWIGPFLQIGVHYLMLKATGGLSDLFAEKEICKIISGFSAALGLLLAMTGSVCLMMIISTVCFMRGVGL